MDTLLQELMNRVKIGARQTHDNMSVLCLLSETQASTGFISLDDALQNHGLRITEVSKNGSVPELAVVNPSEHMALLLDGEEIVGAKQNRALNTTVLVAPKSKTKIPVSCVEMGRWHYSSKKFESRSRTMNADMRKSKSMSVNEHLNRTGRFTADQGQVWYEIDRKYDRMCVDSTSTMAMSAIYESMKSPSEAYMKRFRPITAQIGFIAMIEGKLAGMEMINNYEVFAANHQKLVNSYVIDALEYYGNQTGLGVRSARSRSEKFLVGVGKSLVERRPSVSLGNDLRLGAPYITGCGLEYENEILHLSVFPKDQKKTREVVSSFSRASSRRKAGQPEEERPPDDIIID